MRSPVTQNADARVISLYDLRSRNKRTCRLKPAVEALHVVRIIVGTFAVSGALIVSAASSKVSGRRMVRSRKSAVTDAVAVDVLVAGKTSRLVEICFAQNLAALDRRSRILKRIGHPIVHAEIEIGHDENQRLKLLSQIERILRHGETFGDRTRNQQDVLGIAVREKCGGKNVAL